MALFIPFFCRIAHRYLQSLPSLPYPCGTAHFYHPLAVLSLTLLIHVTVLAVPPKGTAHRREYYKFL